MAKKLIFAICLLFLLSTPAYADDYTCWLGEAGEEYTGEFVAPAQADSESTASGATTPSIIEWTITPYSSYTEYIDGMISTTYLDIAKGMLKHVTFGNDYVFARVGQYRYIFAYGDFSEGFSGSANVYILTTAYSGNTYSWNHVYDTDFNLSVGNGLVYSNLQPYPTLSGSDYTDYIVFAIAFTMCMLFVTMIAKLCFESLFGR